MPSNETYRLVRNQLRRLEQRESLAVIWAYSQFLQLRGFRLPRDIEVDRRFRDANLPQGMIGEWTLELMAREVIRHTEPAADRGRTMRTWATFAWIAQALKDLEDQIYAETSEPAQIHLELMRLSHRQFIWQQQRPRTQQFVRYYKLFDTPEINAVCNEVLGLSVREVCHVGLLLFGAFGDNPRTLRNMTIEVSGLTREHFNSFFAFTSLTFEQLRSKLKAEHGLDGACPHRSSALREFPLVRLRYRGTEEIACPIPTLLFWRFTGGLYYSLIRRPEFANHFGRSFQNYAGGVLAARITAETMQVMPEREYQAGRLRKDTVDWIVADGESALFLECKTKRLTWASKIDLNDLTNLESDIRKLAESVVQVYRTISGYREGLYPQLPFVVERTIFPLVVTLEDWFFFGSELPDRLDVEVRGQMEQSGLPAGWLETMPYSVMSLDELETASGIISSVGIAAFMEGKLRDPERRGWAYHSYSWDRFPNQATALPPLFREECDAIFGEIMHALAPIGASG